MHNSVTQFYPDTICPSEDIQLNLSAALNTAPILDFKTIRSNIVCGQTLSDIKQIERSILQFGLIMPLIVSPTKSGLVVLDGKKRLAAIKRMSFKGTLPRSLTHIPYILVENAEQADFYSGSVLSNRDLFNAVTRLKAEGLTVDEIAEELYLCRKIIMNFIRLTHLSAPLKKALFQNIISFKQALAFASLPDESSQIHWLQTLGPFAEPSEIIAAISKANMAKNPAITGKKELNRDKRSRKSEPLSFAQNDTIPQNFKVTPDNIITPPHLSAQQNSWTHQAA